MLIITTLNLKSENYFLTLIFSLSSGLHTLWDFWWLLGCWHWSFLSLGGEGGKVALKFFLWGKYHTFYKITRFSFLWLGGFLWVIKESCADLTFVYSFIHLYTEIFIYSFMKYFHSSHVPGIVQGFEIMQWLKQMLNLPS